MIAPVRNRWLKGKRAKVAFAHDLVMAAMSYPISLYLRVGSDFQTFDLEVTMLASGLFAIIAAGVFWWNRLYSGVWRYASMNDLIAITRAVTLAVLIFLPVMFLLTRLDWIPRSTLIINWFVLMGLLGGPRFIYRIFKDRRAERSAEIANRRIPILLIGAGDAAELFIRGLARNPNALYLPVGLIDEKGTRVGRNIHGVHVLGDFLGVPLIMERLTREGRRPQRFILTKDNIDRESLREILAIAEQQGVTLSRLPKLTDFRAGSEEGLEVRPVAIEDVLGRPQHVLDRASMQGLIQGRRVMITGAGGTIGGELARQVAAFGPSHLSLVDLSEFLLYQIDLELAERHRELARAAVLADVRDADRIRRVIGDEKPDLVFHAAALKHVPMVESFPEEGVQTNILGTRAVADACRAAGVAEMVLISTDKAVNPTSIMGATKRIAETYCQALDLLAGDGDTRFVTVRFGNVLGSTGSVVPLFQRQLAAGGPLTVTHPEMERYFMTVREAVELVLEASVLGTRDGRDGGKIYVLDMGEPVKIVDLARQMILLSGLQPDKDIRIEFSGIRPGEKLYEEVLHTSENLVTTDYEGILLASPRTADQALLARSIDDLVADARAGHRREVLDRIAHLVPEYAPQPATTESAAGG